MVERVHLTVDIVKALMPPVEGEKWIPDDVVCGFGIRLWSAKRGGHGAYAIRVRDQSGNIRRETFDFDKSLDVRSKRLAGEVEINFADCLDEAREWARERIKEIKGIPTRQDLEKRRHLAREARMLSMTFGEFVAVRIEKMRHRRRSQAYTDRIDKLFNKIIPVELQNTLMSSLTSHPIIDAIISSSDKPGTVRVFRSFMSGVLDDAASCSFALRSVYNEYREGFWGKWEERVSLHVTELDSYAERKYHDLFDRLMGEKRLWQQALCIRLYFELSVPLSRLMSASWRQVYEGDFYPYFPGENRNWYWCRVRIHPDSSIIIDEIRRRARDEFPDSPYLFPTRFGRRFQHIRTVDGMWRNALFDLGIGYYSLKKFAESYRGATARYGDPLNLSRGRDLRRSTREWFISAVANWGESTHEKT